MNDIYFKMVLYGGMLVLIWHVVPCNKGNIDIGK